MIVPTLQLSQMGLREGSDLFKVTEGPAESEAGGICHQTRHPGAQDVASLVLTGEGRGGEGQCH